MRVTVVEFEEAGRDGSTVQGIASVDDADGSITVDCWHWDAQCGVWGEQRWVTMIGDPEDNREIAFEIQEEIDGERCSDELDRYLDILRILGADC